MKKAKYIFAFLLIFFSTQALVARSLDYFFTMPTSFYYSNGDKQHSAPSPIVFNPGFGIIWPNEGFISIEPSLNFYYSYYLWYDGRALPAEIENRTSTTLSFMLDIPAVFTLPINTTKLKLDIGASMLMRFGWLSNGANEAQDVEMINHYFWSQARFLYLSGGITWMVGLPSKTKFGPFAKFYLPLGSLIANEELNGMIISAGLKVSF